jgi:PTH1 family peptidyl-tRNA hydrolase
LRIGIGKTKVEQDTVSHVLGRFSPDESKALSDVMQLVVEAVELSLKQGVEKSMSLYNSRSVMANKESKEAP